MKKNKFLYLTILLFYLSNYFCFSQETKNELRQQNQHTVFVEIFGNSFYLYNITYDYTLNLSLKHKMSVGMGFQYMPAGVEDIFYPHTFSFSPQINYLYGRRSHHLELGLGLIFPSLFYYNVSGFDVDGSFLVPLRIGYRYQRENGGLFWKIALTPLFGKGEIGILSWKTGIGDIHCRPWIGVSIGYTFKNKRR
ncbi:hypothetical protein FACS1894180_3520 [Bacteroidia bacterium]|nr:hypothetical protein FACS1894180_3520 [Bacteroidia bacterium]